jgi:hypothetical protein
MKNKALLVVILLLGLINIYLFWPGNLFFLNDDLLHIPLTAQRKWFQTNSVRPVHELLLRIELFLWNKTAFGYHLTALLLHFVVCIQLYQLSYIIQVNWLKIERQQAIEAALLAVILFLAYPQSSESLGWILGRGPILSAVFFMITVRLFFMESYSTAACLTGAFFFATTLFAYEQSLLLPIALLPIVFLEEEKAKRKGMFRYVLTLLVVDIGYIIVRKLVTSEVVGTYEGGNLLRMNWGTLAANSFRIFSRLIINPANKTAFICSVFILVLFIAFVISCSSKLLSNSKPFIFFTGIIILLIAPVISLGLAVNSFESGRYLYLPSIFLVIGISIAAVSVLYRNNRLRKPLIAIFLLISGYWLIGKYQAAKYYTDASLYSTSVQQKIQQHFVTSSDTLYIDTLHVTIHRLPVFRRGFKSGIKWFNDKIDTDKVVVKNYYDEVAHRRIQ